MSRVRSLLLLAALAEGCGLEGIPPELPIVESPTMDLVEGQGEAMGIILETFGEPGPGPLVRWRRALDGASRTAWLHPDRPAHCVRGLHHEGTLIVALWPGADLAQTSLAHETCHFVEWARGGDGDPD